MVDLAYMKNLVDYFKLALGLMVATEEALPDPGEGQSKKEIVMNAVTIAAKTAEGAFAVSPIVGMIGAFVDVTVAIFNKTGRFKKSSTPVAPAPAA